MPPQTAKSNAIDSLLNDKDLQKSFATSKTKEVRHDTGGDLPPNVKGNASLSECKFDVYKEGDNKGKPFFYIAGVVITPVEHAGMRVNRMIGIVDAKPNPKSKTPPKTKHDRMDEVLNELKLLGVDTSKIDMKQLPAICETLKKGKPIFKFRTWAGAATKEYPNPKVNYVFQGLDDSPVTHDPGSGVEDNTGSVDDTPPEDVDWAAVGEAADGGDTDAQKQITDACAAIGQNAEDAQTWTDAVDWILNSEGGKDTDSSGDTDSDPWQPNKDDVLKYKPPGARKAIECVVTHVFKNTVNLKNMVDNKTVYKGVVFTESPATLGGHPVEF